MIAETIGGIIAGIVGILLLVALALAAARAVLRMGSGAGGCLARLLGAPARKEPPRDDA